MTYEQPKSSSVMFNNMARILIAEDQADLREMIAVTLRLSGHQVEGAEDGQTAYRQAKASHPDLIILDIEMPHLSGRQVCRRLKAIHAFSQVPIVMISSRNDPVEIERSLNAGASEYLPKPFELSHLIERVDALLIAD
jgi:DNA-binding response OmpR family regulator